jgi:subtilisin family serine protease
VVLVSPAGAIGVIPAGASDTSDVRASFSNYGGATVYAPGVNVDSVGIQNDSAVARMSGTSIAAPHISGIVARYLQRHPNWTPHDTFLNGVFRNNTNGKVTNAPPYGVAALANADLRDGALYQVDCNTISGWSWDSNYGTVPLQINIVANVNPSEHSSYPVTAGDFRQDLLAAGIGDGRHALTFPVPPSLKDGRRREIIVAIYEANFLLHNELDYITCH